MRKTTFAKPVIKIFVLTLCISLLFSVPVYAASSQYFTSGSYTYDQYIQLGYSWETDTYKVSTAAYSNDEYHYIRARIENYFDNSVYTDSGRKYSYYSNFCSSPGEIVYIVCSDGTIVNYWWKVARAYYGS